MASPLKVGRSSRYLLVAVCLSTADIQHTACDVGCKRSGYDGGRFGANVCYCYDIKPFELMTEKKLTLGMPQKPSVKGHVKTVDEAEFASKYLRGTYSFESE